MVTAATADCADATGKRVGTLGQFAYDNRTTDDLGELSLLYTERPLRRARTWSAGTLPPSVVSHNTVSN